MSTEDEVRDLMSRASALPYGRGRSQLWAEAAALAESAGLEELALRSNLALIPAYTNGGEGPKLLAPFIWCNAVYKRRPELFTEKMLHRLGWDYKYVITALRFIPTVPRDQCLDILEEMRRYYLSRGDSMRAYYIHGHLLYRDLGEEDAAEEAFQKWRASGPSDLADCAGCDPAHEIDYFRRRKDWEAACRVGDRALADREHYCFQQPESLLTDMLEPWLRTGRDAEAWAGHIRAYRRYQADSTHLSYMPNHIDYLRLSGTPERLERARRILVRHLPWWEQAQYPRNLIDLAVSAARLVRELPGDRHAERLHAILPGEKLKWAPRRTLADPTLADAEEWFTSLALDLADQCDRRPGLLRPFMVAEIRERLREPGLDRPLTANAIPDVSGMATLMETSIGSSPAGAPSSGGADLLPTGRNFYGVDPRRLPTPAAWELGKRLGDEVVSQYIADEGRYPEACGIVLWAGANMRSHGQCVAEFFYLMGVRPVWQRPSQRVVGLEVIPLDELKRPRIDVTGRISGLFRDSMPNAIRWMDAAVKLVSELDEADEENYVRKHVKADAAWLEEQGAAPEAAWTKASYRIFGDPPGVYGAGVAALLESKAWETLDDLAVVYMRFSGTAYGGDGFARGYDPEVFQRRMAGLDVTVKNEDTRETHMFSSDDYNAYHGGMIATVRALTGKAPRSYTGDSSDRQRIVLRSVEEEAARLFRGEAMNPKFIEGMKAHGYKGASDLANYLAHSYQWDATSAVMKDWMYEGYARKYVLDAGMQAWMQDVNPWALHRMAETLLEAQQRGLWNASEGTLAELRSLYLSIEGDLEERAEGML